MAAFTYIQDSFNGGEWSRLMDGRTDFPKYKNAVTRMENFAIDPRGPAFYRTGLRYIAETKTSSGVSQVIPFEFSAETAYMLEFGDFYIRFYKDQAQVLDGGSPYEIASPYAAADLAAIKYCQSVDILYLFHPSYPPLKLSRTSDTAWTAIAINFRPPPTYEQAVLPAATVTLSAVTGAGITFTAGASVFQAGDIGRLIVSGAGRASIVDFISATVVQCDIIDEFASVGPIASGSWEIQGSPVGDLLPSIGGPVGAITTLTSTGTTDTIVNLMNSVIVDLLEDPNNHWIASGSGTNEYYIVNTAPFYSATKPVQVFEDDIEISEGTAGSLAIGEWDFGDNDTLGYSTVYIRLTDETDPDSKASSDESFVKKSTNNDWLASGSGTNEYYIVNTSSFYSVVKPVKMFEADEELVEGLAGSLGVKQWDFSDKDTLGYNTVYIRLSDETDPDTKAKGDESYVKKSTETITTDLFRSTDVGKYIRIYNGFIKVTSYTSAIEVKGEIRKALTVSDPDAVIATSNWTLESVMWSVANGYPSCGVFFEDRLFVAGSTAFSETVWGSATGDYENFTPGTDDADAVQFTLAARQVSVIRWLEPRDYLIIGCTGGEWRVGPDDSGAALTPTNITAKQRRTSGCANILPISINDSTLFVQRAQRQIMEFTYQFESDGYVAPDLTLLAEHITDGSITGMAYQKNPLSIVWCVRGDGKLLGMTYLRDQDVVGWHIHETDGEVENIATIPGDGYDELWMVVKRTINGNVVRNVEMMAKFFTDSNATYQANKGLNAFFVDSGITYNGVATTTITGAGHLEGKDIVALADGSVVTGLTVSGGQFTLPFEASVVHYGLLYTGLLQTMRWDAVLQAGTPQGKPKRIVKMNARVYESGKFKYGEEETKTFVANNQEVGFEIGSAPDLTTDDIELQCDFTHNKEGRLMIIQDAPLPLTLIALMPEVALK